MPRIVRRCLVALTVLAGLALVVVLAWGLDKQTHAGEVMRNTELAGRPIGGRSRAELRLIVADVARQFTAADIRVSARGGGFTTDADQLGVTLAQARTVDAALRLGRRGNPFSQLAGWVGSLFGHRSVPMAVSVDEADVYRTVREQDSGPREEPVEPHIALRDGKLVAERGRPGRGIDARDVIEALPSATAGGSPVVVEVERGEVEPRWTTDDVEALIADARRSIAEPVAVRAGDVETSLRASMVRSWARSRATDTDLELVLDPEAALDDLSGELATAGAPATETRFVVEGDSVRVVAGRNGTRCCSEEAVARIEAAVLGAVESASPIELPLTEREPSLTEAEARDLQIGEPIASFTTRHPAGQPRVENIHRIADLVRGQVILPGASFSVNTFVGRRTREKGFVPAPVIEEGRFSEDIGGGISQFATTLFNAAFFGGLDFGEYQSHSIYISRYPYGREATLSYPHPDLVLKNRTPYGVLIWPTYSGDSITVTLYSKRFVDASQTGQTRTPSGNCTRVVTERTRRYLADGHVDTDTVVARYRPAEGVAC